MLSARTLSNGNNCLTSFLFYVVILWLTKTAFSGNTYHLWPQQWHAWGWCGRTFASCTATPTTQERPPWSGWWALRASSSRPCFLKVPTRIKKAGCGKWGEGGYTLLCCYGHLRKSFLHSCAACVVKHCPAVHPCHYF